MRFAVLNAPGEFEVVEHQIPEPGAGEVLVRVANCGVCASELDVFTGTLAGLVFPCLLGHEVSGVVERVGAGAGPWRHGDAVAVWVRERGFGEYVTAPAGHCVAAEGVPLEQALAEPLSCALNAVEAGGVALGDDVVIIGAGFMGHLVHKLVQLRGPRHVIVADTRDDALERAAGFGATRVVNVSREPLAEVVAELTGGRGADIAFEVTGQQPPLTLLGEVTRLSGTVAIVGYHQAGTREIPLGLWNWNAFRIVNAHFREPATILRGMERGMRLVTCGRLATDGLVTHSFPLQDIGQAFRTALDKPEGFVKAMVDLT
jgi:2-desacetyl-2-hydroxyethyl bacteriochlorophyllide A dehydrogenase